MIARAKANAKRHWPRLRLRTILLLVFVFVAALPGVGALFLRVYENTLVRQTEAELIAQGAALAAAAAADWTGATPISATPLRPEDYRPEPPTIDLRATPVLPERPAPAGTVGSADAAAAAAAARLAPVLVATARTTLASILLLDAGGRILTGPNVGASYAALPEVAAARAGRPATVLRRNGAYRPRYPLEWLSRASDIRIHHARPVISGGRVVGVLLLSRSPRALFRGIYEDRGKIAFGAAAILATLIVLSGLLSRGIGRPIEALSEATRSVARGGGDMPAAPSTAAIEIQSLYSDFAVMAAAIERRSRYLRDFAHAVSHEFKTPLAGIAGAVELLQDHHATMLDDDRRRFLANAAADAERLGLLVTRLLDLARADMSRPGSEPPADLGSSLRRVADAFGRPGFVVSIEVADGTPQVAMSAETLEAILTILIENSRQAGAGRLLVRVAAGEGAVRLLVTDDGPGIPAGDRGRIFEPFFTSRRASGGTGLGLPIARSLIEASGGAIELIGGTDGAMFELTIRPSVTAATSGIDAKRRAE